MTIVRKFLWFFPANYVITSIFLVTLEIWLKPAEIGLGLIGFGIVFTFLGVVLFFDRGLLALSNIFCLTGVALLLGWRSTWNLFTNRANYKGSASFLLGLFFLFVRWPIVGIILQIYGCIALFGGFWPSVKVFLYQIPVLGWIIQYPVLLLDRLRGSS